jgi:hypothetical protein
MGCSALTGGFTLDCNDGVGGIEEIYIANGGKVTYTHTNGLVTGITVDGDVLAPADFFKFEVPKQTSVFTEAITVNQENGTLFYDQSITMVFNRLDVEKRNQIALMAKSNDMVVVVKDNMGKYWSVGLERGAYMGSATATSGTAFGDRSGYEITLAGMETKPSFEITESIVVS